MTILHEGYLIDDFNLYDSTLEDIQPSVTAWLREMLRPQRNSQVGDTQFSVPT